MTDATRQRVEVLYAEQYQRVAVHSDRLFAGLLVGQWLFGIVLAVWISPRAWRGIESETHLHVWIAVLLGAAITSLPVLLVWQRPGTVLTRHAVAVAQLAFSALFIHLTGGRIETHFHVFGSLALLAFYRDWRVLVTASTVVVLDHCIRGYLLPESIYGVSAVEPLRWLEHAAWVVFEDVFLISSCIRGQREMRQISERYALAEAQTKLEAAARAANEANRLKGEFLANMSHEIRTPMSAVIGYADLLMDPQLGASDRVNYVQTIRRNGEHLLGIINDILDISRIEAGKMTAEQIVCSPAQLLVDVASLMRVRAVEKQLFFEVKFLTPVPETIQSDPMRVRQTLMNLVGNALKFTTTGGVRILVRTVDPSGERPELQFDVVDTGIGMTDEQLSRVFDPFAQADSSTTRRFGGTGLGLPICARLAGLLGGEVTATSTPERGSVFTLRVPTGALAGVRMLSDLTEATVTEPAPSEETVRLDCRVLLAEDGLDNQLLISTHLRRAGAEVVIAENGRLAVELAQQAARDGNAFDVILMDMQMPELDGYGATTRLRHQGYDTPIVALTAHAMAGDRERCINAGCTDYLAKPVARGLLLQTVAHHVRAHGSAELEQAKVYSEFSDDPDMAPLVEQFVRGLPSRCAAALDAAARRDLIGVRSFAHNLKGAGGGYGFPQITSAAAVLEQATMGEDEGRVQTALDEMVNLCRRARNSIPPQSAILERATYS